MMRLFCAGETRAKSVVRSARTRSAWSSSASTSAPVSTPSTCSPSCAADVARHPLVVARHHLHLHAAARVSASSAAGALLGRIQEGGEAGEGRAPPRLRARHLHVRRLLAPGHRQHAEALLAQRLEARPHARPRPASSARGCASSVLVRVQQASSPPARPSPPAAGGPRAPAARRRAGARSRRAPRPPCASRRPSPPGARGWPRPWGCAARTRSGC